MYKIVIVIVAALALSSAQNVPASVPQSCSADGVESMDWNNTALFGSWLELTRNPIGQTNACMEFHVGLQHDNVTLSINSTHSSSPTSLLQNQVETATVKLVTGATTGYNVTFWHNNVAKAPVFIKLLKYVNNAYIVGCGYTNATDNSTSYGFILGRYNNYNATGIKLANDWAFPYYSNFENNTNYGNVTQEKCTRNSAAQSLPLISGVLALALLLIKSH